MQLPDKTESFGNDPMDAYSVPLKHEQTELAEIFTLKERLKPGRSLVPLWDERQPIVASFANRYSYLVRFEAVGMQAGNHYHKKKQEFYFALSGEFTIIIEDTKTKEREEFALSERDNRTIYVQPPLAHTVISKTANALLLVQASSPELANDTFEYKVV